MFRDLAIAQQTFEDFYLAIDRVDGSEWADKLRSKMNHQQLGDKHPTEYSWLLRPSMFFA
jgi:hypothetical protein